MCACVRMLVYTLSSVCQPGAGPAGAAIYKQRSLQLSGNHQRQADNTFLPPATLGADREGVIGVSEESQLDPSALRLGAPSSHELPW